MNNEEKKLTPREKVLEEFKSVLEADGALPWERPWEGEKVFFNQRNGVSSRKYEGVNQLLLSFVSMSQGYQDPRWVTFRQAKDLGGHIKKGEKGVRLELWKFLDKDEWERAKDAFERGELQGRPKYGNYLIDRIEVVKRCRAAGIPVNSIEADNRFLLTDVSNALGAVVFNACQCEGLPEPEKPQKHEFSVSKVGLKLIDNFCKNTNLEFIEGDAAAGSSYYKPQTDQVFVPSRSNFKTEEGFLSTCFHEIGHSTMAPNRLNRAEAMQGSYGSPSYALEELRAEISSVIVCTDLGIAADKREKTYQVGENHKAYVQSWLKEIEDKPNSVITAFKAAEKIGDYIEEKGCLPELLQEAAINEAAEKEMIEIEKYLEKNPHSPKLPLDGVSGSLKDQFNKASEIAGKPSKEDREAEPSI